MARNRGWFGTPDRAITDHFKTLLQASEILASEHGTRHRPGERRDLCPKCKAASPQNGLADSGKP